MPEPTYIDDPSTITLLKDGTISRLGRKLMVKYILNLAVMLTFGLAVPLLSIAVICDSAFNIVVAVWLLERFLRLCEQNKLVTARAKREYWDGFSLSAGEATGCVYVVLGYVSVFWSLFAFDWIADVYGSLAGGLTMLVPLLMPTIIGFVFLRRASRLRSSLGFAISRQETGGMELSQTINPVIQPQSICDDFDSVIT